MKSAFSYQHARYTAVVMLFVGLTTLGAGIANACWSALHTVILGLPYRFRRIILLRQMSTYQIPTRRFVSLFALRRRPPLTNLHHTFRGSIVMMEKRMEMMTTMMQMMMDRLPESAAQ